MAHDESKNLSCDGCDSKNLCTNFFLDDYFRSDSCPCRICLVKMVCGSKRLSCGNYEAFWRGNVRKGNQLYDYNIYL